MSLLDINTILIGIKIASTGENFSIDHTCPECNSDNSYEIDLSSLIDHYKSKKYENRLVINDLVLTTRPLNYKQSTDIGLTNFQLQQKLKHISEITDELSRSKELSIAFAELSDLQIQIYTFVIESIKTASTSVVEKDFIAEWLRNTDATTINAIKEHVQRNQDSWGPPKKTVSCNECSAENTITLDMDQSVFFAQP